MTKPLYPNHRMAALGLLINGGQLSRKAGQFLGQLAVDPSPLSVKQAQWLSKLLDTHGLPALAEGDAP